MGQEIQGVREKQVVFLTYDWNNEVTYQYFQGVQRFLKRHREISVTIVEGFGYYGAQEAEEAAFQVFNLPQIWNYDGVIIQGNRVWSEQYKQRIVERAQENHIPAVSLNYPLPGAINVTTDNRREERLLTAHLIREHAARRLCFVQGDMRSQEARDREQGFLDACAEAGIPRQSIRILPGSWAAESGRKAARLLLSEGELPDALVCCNDDMAVGALEVFQEAGVDVPQEIQVTGFDNLMIAQCAEPRITTVDRNYAQIAYTAMELIWNCFSQGIPSVDTVYSPAHQICSMSCGCPYSSHDLSLLRKKHMLSHSYSRIYYQLAYNMGAEMERAQTLEEVLDIFEGYFGQTQTGNAYLVMNADYLDNLENAESVRHYGSEMALMGILSSMEHAGHDAQHAYERFAREDILPQNYRDGVRMMILYPLRYKEICQGYLVVQQITPLMSFHYVECLLQVISDAIEIVRNRKLLQQLNAQLTELYMTDQLTGLYNRFGFNYHGMRYSRELLLGGKEVHVCFLDMDGLKRLNDVHGHDAGDEALQETGRMVRQVCDACGGFAMRYGGDEFITLSAASLREKLQEGIRRVSESGRLAQELSFSMGEFVLHPGDPMSLQQAVDIADDRMYEEKKRKHAQRQD